MCRKLLLASLILISAEVLAIALADVPIEVRDLPPAAQATIERQANGNAAGGFSMEKSVYEPKASNHN